eukprot:CAMPEP_0180186658 /NCGR_PEP_ID=MMETSP0986-20121125/43102_1 /TAXON_ID=697907 /ORGANISM="non described non described, Strain CCMP2293" /LENGTH=1467 /DNA_ID=CAMNT_0022140679 /DNA_START=129 /DNA_END=4533 /DNA_ORIENTATION=-
MAAVVEAVGRAVGVRPVSRSLAHSLPLPLPDGAPTAGDILPGAVCDVRGRVARWVLHRGYISGAVSVLVLHIHCRDVPQPDAAPLVRVNRDFDVDVFPGVLALQHPRRAQAIPGDDFHAVTDRRHHSGPRRYHHSPRVLRFVIRRLRSSASVEVFPRHSVATRDPDGGHDLEQLLGGCDQAADDAVFSVVVVVLVVSTGFVQYLANEMGESWMGINLRCDFEDINQCETECNHYLGCITVPPTGSNPSYHSCVFPSQGFQTSNGVLCKNAMDFHESLYFTIVTFTSVGYGDITPVSALSKMVMICLVVFTVYAIPNQLNQLNALRELRSEYDGTFAHTPGRPFVILCCSPDMDVRRFVAEFFHEDHLTKGTSPQLILLINSFPTRLIRQMLLKYAVRRKLVYMTGDGTSAVDLGRARVDIAQAVFLMADGSHTDHHKQDSVTALRALMARRTNPSVKIYAQILQPENEHMVVTAGVARSDIMCSNQLRLALLGNAVVAPGLPTMLLNLIQSISWRQSAYDADWQEEYSEGMTMEIYNLKLSKELCGTRWADLVTIFKKKCNACLIAVAHEDVVAQRFSAQTPTRAKNGGNTRAGMTPLNQLISRVQSKPKKSPHSRRPSDHRPSPIGATPITPTASGDSAATGSAGAATPGFGAAASEGAEACPETPTNPPDEEPEQKRAFTSHLQFNPEPDYRVLATDIVFVLADEARRLNEFESHDDDHGKPGAVHNAIAAVIPVKVLEGTASSRDGRMQSRRQSHISGGNSSQGGGLLERSQSFFLKGGNISHRSGATERNSPSERLQRAGTAFSFIRAAKDSARRRTSPGGSPIAMRSDIGTTPETRTRDDTEEIFPVEQGGVMDSPIGGVECSTRVSSFNDERANAKDKSVNDYTERLDGIRHSQPQAIEPSPKQAQGLPGQPDSPERDREEEEKDNVIGAVAAALRAVEGIVGKETVFDRLPSGFSDGVGSVHAAPVAGNDSANREAHDAATAHGEWGVGPLLSDSGGERMAGLGMASGQMQLNGLADSPTQRTQLPTPLARIPSEEYPNRSVSRTSSGNITRKLSADGWTGVSDYDRVYYQVPREEEVIQAVDHLISKMVMTYGEPSRTFVDNIRAYVKRGLEDLKMAEKAPPPRLSLEQHLVREMPKEVRDHIIVICSSMDDMQHLMRPVRCSDRGGKQITVCFITTNFPTAREWTEVCALGEVFVMLSTSINLNVVLRRSGAARAKCVLFTSDLEKQHTSTQMADAAVMQGMMNAHDILGPATKTMIISELFDGGFSRKLANSLTTLNPQKVHPRALMHSDKVEKDQQAADALMEMEGEANNMMQGFKHLETAYVAGLSVITSVLDLLLCQQYYNPHLMALMYQMLLGEPRDHFKNDAETGFRSSVIQYAEVPEDFQDKTFGELFHSMNEADGCIVVGLYRQIGDPNHAQHYVYTNPSEHTELRDTDKMYVINPSMYVSSAPRRLPSD